MRRPADFLADRGGASAVLIALCLMALMASAALAVDLGDVFMKTRQLQGVADLAAMAAVQSLGPSALSTPQATAATTAGLNPGVGVVGAQATPGVYTADPTVPAAQRFVAGAANPNAVQVRLSTPVPLYFGGLILGRPTIDISRTAVAARTEYAAFSIGSGLASLNGGVANAVLSALTGSQVQLSVMNYQALASANVDLLSYIPALQTRAGLQALSFDQVLSTSVAPSTALNALADTLTAEGESAAAQSVQALAAASTGLAPTPLGALFDLGPYETQDHASDIGGAAIQVGALGLADALLEAADGSRQLALSLGATVPGVAKLSAWLAIGQRPSTSPWLTITDAGTVVVRTAQMRLYIQAAIAPGALSAVTGGALVTLPVYVEAASAQAKLQDISCPAASSAQAFDLSVSPSLGTLAIAQADLGKLNVFTTPETLTPAALLNLPLLSVTAFSQVNVGGGQTSWQTVRFTQADVAAQTVKSVYANDIAQATVASLLATTSLQVQTPVGGLGLGAGAISPALTALLTGVAPSLDTLIGQIEAVSGVRLGEADVWGNGLRCNGSALVA